MATGYKTEIKDKGKTLVITVDLSTEGRLSSTGGMFLNANSGGFTDVDGLAGFRMNLMVGKKNPNPPPKPTT